MTDLRAQLEAGLASRYTIERELGRGGMATVYLAHDLRHDRPVALKVLHPHLGHALGPERFQREIRLAARLQHPHILTVHDSGEAGDRLWFTMPFIEGESLRDRLDREKQLPVDDALRITQQAAEALEYAHRHGVIHRDIKPENILLTGGHALVADFGIARALSGTTDEHLTSTGTSVGTAAYMSPEQAAAEKDVDARSDIYSLATVLYEMLAGETPFTAATPQAMIARRFTETARPIRHLRDSVPLSVEHALARALARTPADRFASAEAFGNALAPTAVTPLSTPAVPAATAVSAASRPRRLSPALTMLMLGFVIGLGLLFAWSRKQGADPSTELPLIAVLPFRNAGDTADAYFADGMTEEVRGRLAGLSGLRVVASGSTREYRETTKSLPEIGHELGAQYLLTATVRWAKNPDGTSRVRVSPELVRVGDGTATTEWQQPFDAALTDVFQVQGEIADRVATELNVALNAEQHRQLADRPTKSLEAYDLYLRARSDLAFDNAAVRRKAALLEQAVAADPEFTEAWRLLSESYSLLYTNGTPDPAIAERARGAAERAVELDPRGPHGHAALAEYYGAVRKDLDAAQQSVDRSLAVAPNDVDVLRRASSIAKARGEWDAALKQLSAARQLDPRSVGVAADRQLALLWLRRYPESLAASDTVLALAPGDLTFVQDRSMVFAAQGDLAGTREAMKLISPAVSPTEIAVFFGTYWDMYWVLDEAGQRLLIEAGPAAYADRETWATVLMQLYGVRGDRARARAYADTAQRLNAETLRAAPDDAQRTVIGGLQLAFLGRREAAIAAVERGMSLLPLARDRANGPYFQQIAARAYLELGDQERALDLLEPLLEMPYFLSPGWLRIDPSFAALRGNPRFERMIGRG
ncbi:MAG TPA: protein kinase [Gemmatimonadales bacterium]|nr:protein kinase [Gemmatimonadales bacterium]